MNRLSLVLGVVLVMAIVCQPSALRAQDPNDPGEYDTLYFTPGGMRSPTGDTLYVWPGVFPQDVIIYLNAWNDNDVESFTGAFIDNCNGPPCDADLDLEKNNMSESPKCFQGGRMEHIQTSAFKVGDWPPKFYLYAVNVHGEDPMPPGNGLLATFVFTVFDTGRICLDTTWCPPATQTHFFMDAQAYCPVFRPRNFVVANCAYSSGDPNYDGTTNLVDVVYLINYIFRDGTAPCVESSGDMSCDGVVNLVDIVYLIGYLFVGGPPPGYCP
jgi:hypothetical protein